MENIILRSYENVIQTIRQQHVLEIEFSGRGKKKVKKKRENEETLEHHLFPPSLLCSAPWICASPRHNRRDRID